MASMDPIASSGSKGNMISSPKKDSGHPPCIHNLCRIPTLGYRVVVYPPPISSPLKSMGTCIHLTWIPNILVHYLLDHP